MPALPFEVCGSVEEARSLMHEALDRWFDQVVPLFENGKAPTIIDLSRHFSETRGELMGSVMQAMVEKAYHHHIHQEQAICPECARILKRKRFDRKAVSTLHGEFTLNRPYFYCQICKVGFHPLDDVLTMAPERHQYDVQEKAVKSASKLPFEESADQFSSLTGVDVGDHFLHDTLNAVGDVATLELVIPDRKEIERRIDEVSRSIGTPPILAVGADGAHMPTRVKAKRNEKRGQGSWKEAKGFRLYLVGEKGRIVQIASWHQIQDAEAFRKDLALVAGRIPQDRVRVALLADGAEWLWPAMTACFPTGRPILDFYHCAEHVHEVGNSLFGKGELKARQWSEAILSLLSYSEMDDVLAILRGMRPETEETGEKVRNLAGYLEKNRDRIHYETDRDDGYPIGSGGIESSHKYVCHTRMKRSGAWWVIASGNNMLRIRCAIVNGTYERVFEHYATHPRRSDEGC
ncbi:MAG: ISKra4 family transposase [Magnetococcales bacterium]|nr:ISKra4 family transposase [Magnetococcales bacterium]